LGHAPTRNNNTVQQPVDQEIDPTEKEINLEGLGEAVAECIQNSQAASSERDSPEEGSDLDETDAVPTRKNTMACTSNPNPDTKEKGVALLQPPNLTSEQIQQIRGALARGGGNTKKQKIKERSTFQGKWDELKGWLAQRSVYFKGVGWEFEYDNDKIV